MTRFRLRFDESEIEVIAERYRNSEGEEDVEALVPEVMRRGHLTKSGLQTVARWKSPRSSRRTEENSEAYVEELTRFCLHTRDERARIEPLTTLTGVQWPTASVILHFFRREAYPILDFRALWSLLLDPPGIYRFEFWWKYVVQCRALADSAGVGMRTLDKALWQYSKENQPAR